MEACDGGLWRGPFRMARAGSGTAVAPGLGGFRPPRVVVGLIGHASIPNPSQDAATVAHRPALYGAVWRLLVRLEGAGRSAWLGRGAMRPGVGSRPDLVAFDHEGPWDMDWGLGAMDVTSCWDGEKTREIQTR